MGGMILRDGRGAPGGRGQRRSREVNELAGYLGASRVVARAGWATALFGVALRCLPSGLPRC